MGGNVEIPAGHHKVLIGFGWHVTSDLYGRLWLHDCDRDGESQVRELADRHDRPDDVRTMYGLLKAWLSTRETLRLYEQEIADLRRATPPADPRAAEAPDPWADEAERLLNGILETARVIPTWASNEGDTSMTRVDVDTEAWDALKRALESRRAARAKEHTE